MKLSCGSLLIALTLTLGSASGLRADTLLYDNGFNLGTWGASNISSNPGSPLRFALSDSFTIGNNFSLTRADVGFWTTGATPVSVDWEIGSSPFASDIAAGNGVLNSVNYVGQNFIFSIWSASLPLTGAVTPGTYCLSLSGALTFNPAVTTFWDVSNGPSAAISRLIDGSTVIDGPSPSESFRLYGVPVPEPSVAVLLTIGLVALGCFRACRTLV